MKISTKGRYALRMLVDLAENQKEGYLSLNEIAERQNISKKYLEQIVALLRQNALLRSIKGPHGGYLLSRRGNKGSYRLNADPEKCTVGDILRATEGSLAPVACLEYEVNDCPRLKDCNTLYIWEEYYRLTKEYFDGITITDIVNHKE